MAESTPGGNLPVTAALVRVSLYWSGGADVPAVDAAAVLLMADGQVASGADLVYREQPRHVSGSVTHAGKSTSTLPDGPCFDVLDANLAALPPTIERIAVVATADGGLDRVPDLRLVLADLASGAVFGETPLSSTTATAMVAGELYRHAGSWEFRADGPASVGDAGSLARDFGLAPDAFGAAAGRPSGGEHTTAAPPPSFAAALPAVPAPPPPLPVPVPAPGRAPGDRPPAELRRGEQVQLANATGGPVNRVTIDLAWEAAPGRLTVALAPAVLAVDAAGTPLDTVSPQHPDAFGGAVRYAGQAMGEGAMAAGERIVLDLLQLPDRLTGVILALTSADPAALADLRRAACYLSDDVGHRLAGYEMTEIRAGTALLMAELRRAGTGRWQLRAVGEQVDDDLLAAVADQAASNGRQRGTRS